jgi:hypothetical protein
MIEPLLEEYAPLIVTCSPSIITPEKPGEEWWNLENIGIVDCPYEKDDDLAMLQFSKSIRFVNGRYQVKWPMKTENPEIQSNYHLALGRLRSMYKHLEKMPTKLLAYHDIIEDQFRKQMIEPLLEEYAPIICLKKFDSDEYFPIYPERPAYFHYLPHQAVETPQKTTTKIRIVFNASARCGKNAKSPNDILLRGPVIPPDLAGMIMQFRTPRIAILADIEKAFLHSLWKKD